MSTSTLTSDMGYLLTERHHTPTANGEVVWIEEVLRTGRPGAGIRRALLTVTGAVDP